MESSAAVRPLLPPWWEEWAGRLEFELAQFERRGLEARVLEDPRSGASRLVVETTMDLDEVGLTPITAVYPDGYPHRRFALYAPTLNLRRHQSPDGNLCVFARDAKFWDPKFLAADAIADAVPRLLRLVREGGEALRSEEDPQAEPFTTYYGGVPLGGIVLEPSVLDIQMRAGIEGTMEIHLSGEPDWLRGPPEDASNWSIEVGQGLLAKVLDANGATLAEIPPEQRLKRFSTPHVGRWVYLPDPPRTNTPQELWDAVVDASPATGHWTRKHEGLQLIGLCTLEEVQQDTYAPAWVFLARTKTPQKQANRKKRATSGNPAKAAAAASAAMFSEPKVIRGLPHVPDDLTTRIPELKPLSGATISLVGLGSLGAPLFQELVKSRVGHLRICDYDFVDPATAVRYPLGLECAGIDKAIALALWAQRHDPNVDIEITSRMFGAVGLEGAKESEQETLRGLLENSDLVVSATAESDVNRQLDLAALRAGVPRLFLWSQSGYGGVVALLRQGRTGCYHCLSLYLSPESDVPSRHRVEVPPDDADGQPAGTIQGRGCADKTFAAAHADLLPLSIQAARVAFGYLCGDTEGGYPSFEDDVFIVQMRRPDGQPIPPRWESFRLLPDPACPICSPA